VNRPPRPDPSLLADPGHLLAFGFGTGLAPVAPGTFGTLAGLPIVLLWWWADAGLIIQAATLAILIPLGIWTSARAATALGVHDHGAIVVDEIAGIALTFVLVPPSIGALVAGFALFRLFDIVKPWPISWLDRHVHGGLGIMADDVVAGVAACACLHLLLPWLSAI
jgi:phosphatidylglycerophosphatase A